MPNEPEYGPVPLLLGVVGHRHLDVGEGRLRDVIRNLLLGFRERYPCTRVILLSALAEGADRLVAAEALDLGFSLVAPLPMPVREYEEDFATPESIAEFRALLARAEASFVVPSVTGEAFGDRSAAYANCGAYIARRCVELIALWDGHDSPTGGTADIVRFQLEGIPAPYVRERDAFDPSVCGPVLQVVTPRKPFHPENAAFSVIERYPRSSLTDPAEAFSRAKFDIERFNHDVALGPFSARVRGLPVRQQAGELAGAYQRRTTGSLVAISVCVFLAVVAFNAYTIVPTHPFGYLLAYIAFSGVAFVPYLLSGRKEWQLRYQDYRALEQILRTHEYWRMAGIERSVAAGFSASERTKVDWIAIALRALTEPFVPERPKRQQSQNLRAIYEGWVLDQQSYFTRFAGRREHRRERVSSQLVAACVALSIALTIGSHVGASLGVYRGSLSTVLIFATILAVGAALIHNFAEKRGWSEHARHYELMAALFGDAAERIAPLVAEPNPKPSDLNRIHALLVTLGDEAIRETVAWLNLHRSRPLSVPRV
jgi:hypothetical protein